MMNGTSGKFTAPRDGIYSFSFTGRASFPASTSQVYLGVHIFVNGNWIGSGSADEVSTAEQFETFSFQSTLNLQTGDQIWLEIAAVTTGVYLQGNYFTQFSGYLIEENLEVA